MSNVLKGWLFAAPMALMVACEQPPKLTEPLEFRASAAQAKVSRQRVLLASEDFDYTAGTFLTGQDGGVGWISPWLSGYASGSLQVETLSLSVSGVPASGGKAVWGTGEFGISSSRRQLEPIESGVVYLEFIALFSAQTGGGTPNIRLKRGGPVTAGIGGNGLNTYAILDENLNAIAGGVSTALLSEQARIIVRFDYGCRTTTMWTNPDATFDFISPPASSISVTGFAPTFDELEFIGRAIEVDGIRLYRVTGPGSCKAPSKP